MTETRLMTMEQLHELAEREGFVVIQDPRGWYLGKKGELTSSARGPFATEDAAFYAIPGVIDEARENELRSLYGCTCDMELQGVRAQWWIYEDERHILGPYESKHDALLHIDEIPAAREERQRSIEEISRRKGERRVQEIGIPARYAGCTLDTYKAKTEGQKQALAVAKDYAMRFTQLRESGPLVFCGSPKSGKTRLVLAMAEDIARAGHTVRYVTAADVIRARIGPDSTPPWNGSDLLIVDNVIAQSGPSDIMAELVAALAAPHLEALLQARATPKKPTVLVCDCDSDSLARYLGEGSCGWVVTVQ